MKPDDYLLPDIEDDSEFLPDLESAEKIVKINKIIDLEIV